MSAEKCVKGQEVTHVTKKVMFSSSVGLQRGTQHLMAGCTQRKLALHQRDITRRSQITATPGQRLKGRETGVESSCWNMDRQPDVLMWLTSLYEGRRPVTYWSEQNQKT